MFVIYQENRSFDSYCATFPGAEGLFSYPNSQTEDAPQVEAQRDILRSLRVQSHDKKLDPHRSG